jgi:hypothetical protein
MLKGSFRLVIGIWFGLMMSSIASVSLDGLIEAPMNWEMTPSELEEKFGQQKPQVFVWLTQDKTRAKFTRRAFSNKQIDLTLFEGAVPVEEAIVDFYDGKLNLVTFSVYNRADSGKIQAADFKELYTTLGKQMSKRLKARPSARKSNKAQGLLTEGYSWYSQNGVALLEHNEGALDGADKEFLRLRVSRKGAKGGLAASMTNRRGGASVRSSSLKNFVEEDREGNIYVKGLPMVDQGAKGYCVVASVQRLFEYFGIGADMHQLAEVAEADPNRGTSTYLMAKSLDKIDYRFKTRLKILAMTDQGGGLVEVDVKKGEYYVGDRLDRRKVMKMIKDSIGDGLPILWSLELGKYPEKPQLNPQTSGGHMRLIIGYNEEDETLIFSDSWGAGHEFKTMKWEHAYRVTHGLFVLKPTVN